MNDVRRLVVRYERAASEAAEEVWINGSESGCCDSLYNKAEVFVCGSVCL